MHIYFHGHHLYIFFISHVIVSSSLSLSPFLFLASFRFSLYTRDFLQREARASDCTLQSAREESLPYPTCCYARYVTRAVIDAM